MFVRSDNGVYYPVSGYDYNGLEGIKIGKFFGRIGKNLGVNLGRFLSAGLWDPSKNRFFVPFSSGHVRTFGKGMVGSASLGLVNSDKFFDSRTMRTIGTVVGATGGAAAAVFTGGLAAPALIGGSGGVASGAGGLLSSAGGLLSSGASSLFGGVKSLFGGSGLFSGGGLLQMAGGLFGGGKSEQPQQTIEVPQTGYPTLMSPMSIYPPPVMQYPPYVYSPYTSMVPYQYSNSDVERLNSLYKSPIVSVPTIEESNIKTSIERKPSVRREVLPGGVEITTLSGHNDLVNSFGVLVSYKR